MSATDVAAAFELLLTVLNLAILGRVLLSWVDPSPYPDNPIKRLLWALTEPLLEPIRRLLPAGGMVDFSPLVAILVLMALSTLVRSLFGAP